jgi:hypothetical protein
MAEESTVLVLCIVVRVHSPVVVEPVVIVVAGAAISGSFGAADFVALGGS